MHCNARTDTFPTEYVPKPSKQQLSEKNPGWSSYFDTKLLGSTQSPVLRQCIIGAGRRVDL